ncbi:MAG: protein-disulfide reductase DsbD domain-containing protein [Flavisolibacter sp.]
MRKVMLLLLGCLFTFLSFAQKSDPVFWSFSSKKINATTYEVRLSARMDDGWHIYSQSTPDGGPVPTTVGFSKNPLLATPGGWKEVGKLEQHFEPLFGVDVKQYSDKVEFVRTVTVKAGVKTALKGNVEFMTCNDTECLPPKTVNFSIDLK